MPLLWSLGSYTYINFNKFLQNYEFIITKIYFHRKSDLLWNFYTAKIWSHTVPNSDIFWWWPAKIFSLICLTECPDQYVIVKPHHEEDIFVITQGRGGAEAEV